MSVILPNKILQGIPGVEESDNSVARFAGGATITGSSNVFINDNGELSIGKSIQENDIMLSITQRSSSIPGLKITGELPHIYIDNSSEEDIAEGRECRIIIHGEDSLGVKSMQGFIEFGHDGSNTDQKAYCRIALNNGNNGENPTERIRILSNGYVGIGNKEPNTLLYLDINDIINNDIVRPFTIAHHTTGIAANGIGVGMLFELERDTGASVTMGAIDIIGTNVAASSYNSDMIFYTRSTGDGYPGTEKIRIKNTGKIGIGTTNPDATLEINAITGGTIRGTYNDSDGSASDHWDISTGENGEFTLTTTDSDGTAGDIILSPDGLVSITTDAIFFGSGSGFPYGCISGDDETVTCTLQDTYYQTTFDTVQCENLMAGSIDDNHITVQKTGIYKMEAMASFHSAVAHDFEFQIKKNDGASDIPHAHSYQTTSVANQVEGISITITCSLTANDTLELWVKCTDAAGQACIFDHVNLCANMIGG